MSAADPPLPPGPAAEARLLHHGGRSGRWGNLGLWPDDLQGTDYATACTALADCLAQAAALERGTRLLALGCGAGEELRHWQRRFALADSVGLEPDAARRAIARRGEPAGGDGIEAIDEDGARAPRLLDAPASELLAAAGDGFHTLLALDSAYHFGQRARWLAQAHAALRPGGRIAFTDLVLEPRGALQSLAASALRRLAQLPAVHIPELTPRAGVLAALAAAGFEEVEATDLSHAVLGGFARFVALQARRIGPLAATPAWARVAATARWIGPARRIGLHYLLFSARRR